MNDFYQEAAEAAEREGTTIEEQMKHIDNYLADSYEYIFRDEEDEIKNILKHEKNAGFIHDSAYTRHLLRANMKTMIENTDKYFCVVLQKYGKVVAVVSNCTMYISKKCTAKDIFVIKQQIKSQIGE